jgi:hypothetical protein
MVGGILSGFISFCRFFFVEERRGGEKRIQGQMGRGVGRGLDGGASKREKCLKRVGLRRWEWAEGEGLIARGERLREKLHHGRCFIARGEGI